MMALFKPNRRRKVHKRKSVHRRRQRGLITWSDPAAVRHGKMYGFPDLDDLEFAQIPVRSK